MEMRHRHFCLMRLPQRDTLAPFPGRGIIPSTVSVSRTLNTNLLLTRSYSVVEGALARLEAHTSTSP